MISPEATTLNEQIASLSNRIAQLESLNAVRQKNAKLVVTAAAFLGFLMTLLFVGVFITSIVLTNISGHLGALLQSVMFTSCLASGILALISLLAKAEPDTIVAIRVVKKIA